MSAGGQASRAHLRRLAAVPLALAACAAIAACGGSGHGTAVAATTPAELVSRAVSASDTVSSGRISLAATVELHGIAALGGKPVTIDVAGPFARGAGGAVGMDLDATINAGSGPASVALDIVGRHAYLGAGGAFYELPARRARFAHRIAASGATGALGALGIDLGSWLEDPHVVGTAEVGGVQTQHLSARLDVATVVVDLTKLLAQSSAHRKRASGAAGASGASGAIGATGASATTGARGRRGATGSSGATGASGARGGSGATGAIGAGGSQISAGTLLPLLEQAITSARVDVYTGTSDHIVRELDLSIDFTVPALASGLLGGLSGGSLELVATLTQVNAPQTITAPPNAHSSRGLLNGIFALESQLGSLSSLFAGSGSLVG